jgi:hypothetical protein
MLNQEAVPLLPRERCDVGWKRLPRVLFVICIELLIQYVVVLSFVGLVFITWNLFRALHTSPMASELLLQHIQQHQDECMPFNTLIQYTYSRQHLDVIVANGSTCGMFKELDYYDIPGNDRFSWHEKKELESSFSYIPYNNLDRQMADKILTALTGVKISHYIVTRPGWMGVYDQWQCLDFSIQTFSERFMYGDCPCRH